MNGCALARPQPRIEDAHMIVLQKNVVMIWSREQRVQRIGALRICGHSVFSGGEGPEAT
jgi:hypothetical protein